MEKHTITREAKVGDGVIVLAFKVDGKGVRFDISKDDGKIKVYVELPPAVTSHVTDRVLLTSKKGLVLTVEDVKGPILPYWGKIEIPVQYGRGFVKRLSEATAKKIEELIEETKAEAEALGLKGWLWEQAKWTGTEWVPVEADSD